MRFGRQGPSLVVNTPAKLNLYLEVLGRRPDGYHELETVMVSIGLYDTLLFTEDDAQQTRLRCHWATASDGAPSAPRDENARHGSTPGGIESDEAFETNNLVIRSAELLREQTGCRRGVVVDLWKRIPLQSGLGGGSSDAAATLVGLNRLWQLGLTSKELHALAARLGSDVNFFLESPRAALCTGRGEQIAPLEVAQRLHFVVVCPPTGLATGEVFRQWGQQQMEPRAVADFTSALVSGRVCRSPQMLHNALEAPARQLSGDVAATLEALRATGGAAVLMSGSGSSCFAICRSRLHARLIAGRIRQLDLGRTFAVALLA